MIAFEDLAFRYSSRNKKGASHKVLSGFSHRFEKGRFHVLIGPSGCGKTTLMYLAAGLLLPEKGSVWVHGVKPRPGNGSTAVVLQDYGLFPWKTAMDNLVLGLKIRGAQKAQAKAASGQMLDELGLSGKGGLFPGQLSGGERQRLALGRALILQPDLLLLDEPFSSLDAMTRERLQDSLKALSLSRRGSDGAPMTVLMITHSIEEAVYLGDTVHLMDKNGSVETVLSGNSVISDRSSSRYFASCAAVRGRFESGGGRE